VKLEEVRVVTGEEDEDILYKERAKLYRFDADSKEWKERGTGDVKLLKHKQTNKVRIILRQEKTLKLCVNHLVPPMELKPNLGSDRAWTWASMDFADENNGAQRTFAIKFKNPEVALTFKTHFDQAREMNNSAASSTATTECKEDVWQSILKARKFTPLKVDDIKVLFEKYDSNKSGSIDAKELSHLFSDLITALGKAMNTPLSESEKKELDDHVAAIAASVLKSLDKNNDSQLSWDEFSKVKDISMLQHL